MIFYSFFAIVHVCSCPFGDILLLQFYQSIFYIFAINARFYHVYFIFLR